MRYILILMVGWGPADVILILRQLKEKYFLKKMDLSFGSIDLDKPFEHFVVWWTLRTLCTGE